MKADSVFRSEAKQQIRRQASLVVAVNRLLADTLSSKSDEEVARTCLALAEELTGSKFGFITELNQSGRADAIAVSSPGWQACRIPQSEASKLLKNVEVRSYWGRALREGRSQIVNDPASDPDRMGTPEGHPPITSFLGVPLKGGGRVLGLIGLANKESGYTLADQEDIEALSVAFVEALNRRRLDQALRESEAKFRVLVETSPSAIFVEQDGRLVYMNPAGLRFLGYDSVSELQSYAIDDLFAPGGNPSSTPRIVERRTLPGSRVEGKWVRKDGELVDVEILLAETTYQGRPAIWGLASDVTETKRLRQQAERMERLAALGQLAATIAHEIRNPIGAISLNLQYLSSYLVIPENLKHVFDDIARGVQRIQNTIEAVLAFAHPRAPVLDQENLHSVLDSSIRALKDEFQKAGITIIKTYDAVDPYVCIDAHQITQVFINLLINAKEAMPAGGKIFIRTMSDRDSVVVEIEDTGEGIPPVNLERIFDPFFTTKSHGTGLGLAVVARILKYHHSEISVESSVGSGTRFTIRFPVAREGQVAADRFRSEE